MTPVSQFKVSKFHGFWWWMLYTRDEAGHETVIRRGNCRHEQTALFIGLVKWAMYDFLRTIRNARRSVSGNCVTREVTK